LQTTKFSIEYLIYTPYLTFFHQKGVIMFKVRFLGALLELF